MIESSTEGPAMNLRESVQRIHSSQEVFGERFYQRFFERQPGAKKFFREIHLPRQAVILTMQLSVIQAYHDGRSRAAGEYLQVLGSRHHDLGVPRELYPEFCDTLLETMAGFLGDGWTEELAGQWRAAMDAASEKMFEGYEQHYFV
jgi:hemoglobin-like flavoprotein